MFEENEYMKDGATALINLTLRREQLLSQLRIAEVNKDAKTLASGIAGKITALPNAPEYRAAADTLGNGIPAWFIGCLHYREVTSMSLRAYLGNGEMIIGTNRKTQAVPKMRGPFMTFHEGAVDALRLSFSGMSNWNDTGNLLVRAELWNGEGYNRLGMVNPYLFAGTSIYHKGKFDYDGRHNPNLVDQELGIVCIMKALGIV
jgi:lysozyme family protein